VNTVTYSLNPNQQLMRTQSVNGDNANKMLATNVTSINMSGADIYTGGKITLNITSHIDDIRSATEARTFVVFPRPSR
jgi:hypothetical protein